MAEKGVYSDVNLLKQLSDKIKHSSEAMTNIEQDVSNYLFDVRENLKRQLDSIQIKLEEAEERLRQAENTLTSCQASQICNEFGELTPSCTFEESAVETARSAEMEWRRKYEQGKQIYGECQQDIDDYYSGGRALIRNMNEQQTKASQILFDCVERLQDILSTDVAINSEPQTSNVSKVQSQPPANKEGEKVIHSTRCPKCGRPLPLCICKNFHT